MGRAAVTTPPRRASSLDDGRARLRSVARPAAPAVEARLALAEVLIGVDPGVESAERCVEWLVEYAGAEQVVCLGLDLEQKRLSPIASHGLPASVVASTGLDIEERAHPVVAVLFGRRPVIFDGNREPGVL